MRRLIAAGVAALFTAAPGLAQDFGYLGHGRLVNNDVFFDLQDRWQSGSVAASYVWGPEWQGALPTRPGQMLEFRLHGQIVAPDNLRNPDPADRLYANAVSFGLHTHFQWRGIEIATGGDLVVTGDQTGLYHIQNMFHDIIGVPKAEKAVRSAGIGNGFHGSLVAEVGRSFDMGNAQIRPFVEGRYGVETLVRAGVDLTVGEVGRGELLVRDPVSGNRYRTLKQHAPGFSFVMGADVAKVTDSIFLPEPAFGVEDRARVRAGVHWEGKKARVFYGVTWLSKEFSAQTEGQVIGSLRLDYDF
ncbi:MAG: lipid A-modifier LpxR family protein [Pseudooceanicola sp.]